MTTNARTTWGVDMSTDPRGTAAVCIAWLPGRAEVVDIRSPIDAPGLVDLITAHPDATWAVDVPFGWPMGFAEFVAAHPSGPTPITYPGPRWASPVRLRRTDEQLTAGEPPRRIRPLSVAHDRLGSVAVLWAFVEHGLATSKPPIVIDRSGMTGACFETYPTGIRVQWDLPKRGTEGERDEIGRRATAAGIDVRLMTSRDRDATEHEWDALLCAMAARSHQLGDRPHLSSEDEAVGRIEGWIHLPRRPLESLVTTP